MWHCRRLLPPAPPAPAPAPRHRSLRMDGEMMGERFASLTIQCIYITPIAHRRWVDGYSFVSLTIPSIIKLKLITKKQIYLRKFFKRLPRFPIQ
ncbi:hypothetical protein ACH3XW_9620 [Acanthocheilonema viteae]